MDRIAPTCTHQDLPRRVGYRQWKFRYRFGIPSEEREKYNNLNNLNQQQLREKQHISRSRITISSEKKYINAWEKCQQ